MSPVTVNPFRDGTAPDDVTVVAGRDKSLTHRAVMFSALAAGESIVVEPLLGADCLSTVACFKALGVSIEVNDMASPPFIRVTSPGAFHLKSPSSPLDCGNSGTTARLITGILAALPGVVATLVGDASLSSRPMDRVVKPLKAMGANITGEGPRSLLPLRVMGRNLRPLPRAHIVDKASAQVKSALILAGMLSEGQTSVHLPLGSRDHTEKILQGMGAKLTLSRADGYETIGIAGPFAPSSRTYTIPVDPSSAAFFAVLGALRLGGTVTLADVLDNPTRTGFLSVLGRMLGKPLAKTPAPAAAFLEPVMTLRVQGGQILLATDITPAEVPTLVDEIPILAVAAAFAQGTSHFKGLGELRVKESDRLAKVAELLEVAGVAHHVEGDDLTIQGLGSGACQSFVFNPAHDHRLAMAASVMAKRAAGLCRIHDPECVNVSFPRFFATMDQFL